jgi:hypothetical protein
MNSTCMQRIAAYLAVLGLAALSPASPASAAPTITSFRVKAVPIPGFQGTGNILGAAAMIHGEAAITGDEYDGSPSPLIGLKLYAPKGTKLDASGFATCAPAVLEQSGPQHCPKLSIAGPTGFALGVVTFGDERVPETASVQPFFAPGGRLVDFVRGTTPVSLEILATAHVIGLAPPFGLEFSGEIPLIETVPGAPDASFEEGAIGVGAAYRKGNRTISYVRMPSTCPRGGWPVKLEMSFLGGTTAEASHTMQCPGDK